MSEFVSQPEGQRFSEITLHAIKLSIDFFELVQCYHCDAYLQHTRDETEKCMGCNTIFCTKNGCAEWVCFSKPVCESCDLHAIQRGSKKRLNLLTRDLFADICSKRKN